MTGCPTMQCYNPFRGLHLKQNSIGCRGGVFLFSFILFYLKDGYIYNKKKKGKKKGTYFLVYKIQYNLAPSNDDANGFEDMMFMSLERYTSHP